LGPLNDKQKKIFMEAGNICIKTNREVTAQLHQKLPKSGISIAEYCKKNKVKVIELTAAERQAFAKAMKPVWEKYKKIVGADLYDFFQATIKKHSK
jgi:TRAP-type C4-dicarboxylate transport system substrate-binding protein